MLVVVGTRWFRLRFGIVLGHVEFAHVIRIVPIRPAVNGAVGAPIMFLPMLRQIRTDLVGTCGMIVTRYEYSCTMIMLKISYRCTNI